MNQKGKALIALFEQWKDCEKCELGQLREKKFKTTNDQGNIVFGDGNPEAEIVIIGTGPGEAEDKMGAPYAGEEGSILDSYLQQVQLNRRDLFLMNVVACRPFSNVIDFKTKKSREETREPTSRERELCRPLWHEVIYTIDPLLIIAMGRTAIAEVVGKRPSSMRDVQGTIQTCTIPGRVTTASYPVMAVYHPSTLSKSGNTFDGGPWHQALVAWKRAVMFYDRLKNLYYGTPMPDRGIKTADLFVGGNS